VTVLDTIATANQGTAQTFALLAAVVLAGTAVAAFILKQTVLAVLAVGLVLLAVAVLFHA